MVASEAVKLSWDEMLLVTTGILSSKQKKNSHIIKTPESND